MYLNCHTYYSLRYGTIKPKDLLSLAQKNGVTTLALTDINNTSACLDFIRLAPEYDIKPIVGIDFRNSAQQQFVGIARNNAGFHELNDYLSSFLHNKNPIPTTAKQLFNSYVIYPFKSYQGHELKDHEYIGIAISDLNKLVFSPYKKQLKKLVIMQTVSFRNQKDFNAHRLLRAIDLSTLLSKLPKDEEGLKTDQMHSIGDLSQAFEQYPEIIHNTQQLLAQCEVHFEFGSEHDHKNQKHYKGSVEEDAAFLRELCDKHLNYRYPEPTPEILARIEKELDIIIQKQFVSYFLINWDIICYARSKGYFHVGRGSGANSIIAYILRITDVDPVELDLYFERFINLYRQNPPDFDIDFSWTDRDDVTRYIFERFENVSLLAVYNTFQYRAVVRELGKVFGLPKTEIDILSSGQFQANKIDQVSMLVLKYGHLIQGFPNHLSIHSAGILISEKPIHNYTATFMPPKGFPTTQFDMIVAEDVGLYKFDILSQRGLAKIKDALGIIKENNPNDPAIDIHDIKRFKEDPKVKSLLRNAQAIGCFYVESPAMRMLLKKLQVDDYLGLVAASSVIRPGVAKSGMMREYILRFRFPEKRKEANPVMLELMPETYGVMVYQEDVIKVAHYFAGLSLGEADMLRRGMSGKFRSREEFQKVKDQFFINCKDKGYPDELTKEVWRQTESFAGYAFAKGHSASYAVESYQCLFLKAYYPLEYMVATINNFGGFYRTEYYVHEARMHGGQILAPCINKGYYETHIEQKNIYLGFMLVNELEIKVAKQIVKERESQGPYLDFDDFIDRVPITVDQASILIRVNAFRFTLRNKRALLWEAHFKLGKATVDIGMADLFKIERQQFVIPQLERSQLEDAFDDLELIGFPLIHPFRLLQNDENDEILVRDLINNLNKQVHVKGYWVTVKTTKTSKGDAMYFGNFLDREGAFLDTVHFPQIAKQYPFRGRGVYDLFGKVVEEFGCYTIEVNRMYKTPIIEDPRYAEENKFKHLNASA
ncbi:MAG: DNA polymerase III subunit alpha [Reichenbachiella sp.]